MFVKGSFPSKYMDSWQRFNEMSLPVKKELYNNLTIVTSKKGLGRFWNTNLSKNYDLYLQSDILLQVDVFESFRNKCIEIYKLALFYFLSSLVLAWRACLKKAEVELELFTDVERLAFQG